MKKILFLLCLLSAKAIGQDAITKPIIVSGGSSYEVPAQSPSLAATNSDFVWNKWDTENFIVLSIDKSQGLYLKKNIEDSKNSFQKRWGFENSNIAPQCKILCVPELKLLTRFFSIDSPRAETRKNSDGVFSSAIWTCFDKIENIDYLVASVCLESSSNSMLIRRGILKLENPVDSLKKSLSVFNELNVRNIMETDEAKWNSLSVEEKEKFDNGAALICLLLRREFGISKFSDFVRSKQDVNSIMALYKFEDLELFSKTVNRYSKYLAEDISSGRTPDKYLILKQ